MSCRQQRGQDLRERRTDAASEFAKSVHASIALILDAVKGEDPRGCPRVSPFQAAKTLNQLHVAESDYSRVQLLFSGTGRPVTPARETRDQLQKANEKLTKAETKREVMEAAKVTEDRLTDFVSAAANVVKK
jgi:hypothetical protein